MIRIDMGGRFLRQEDEAAGRSRADAPYDRGTPGGMDPAIR